MEDRSTIALAVLLFVSFLGHVGLWVLLGILPPIEEMLAQSAMEVMIEPVDLEPEPEPEPEIEAPEPDVDEPEPIVQREPRERSTTPEPEPEPEPEEEPPAAEEAIADFTGETLTNDSGEAWQSATGSGGVMEGPIGQPGAQVTGRRREGVRGGVPGGRGGAEEGPQLVAARNLSRRPGPPESRLIELLQNNMPRRARDLGLEGNAVVRIRVGPDGRVQPLAVISEEQDGFGQACRRSIRQSGRWQPPLDRSGQPVATITTFRCGFTISF